MMKLYEIEYLVYNGLRTAKYVRKVDDNLITNNIRNIGYSVVQFGDGIHKIRIDLNHKDHNKMYKILIDLAKPFLREQKLNIVLNDL